MGWHKLVFKQNLPIHVGSSKWGVVNETEIFIPGQTIWGALTNTYLQRKGFGNESIDQINKYFQKISNFFPSFDRKSILQPTYQKGEFGYLIPDLNKKEFLSEEKFRFYFVDTIVQTAIEPLSRSAKDESLHELDFILPQPKIELENFKDYLYWIGIIHINNNLDDFLKKNLKIFIGADVRYGYGELELINIQSLDGNDKKFWWIEDNNITLKDDTNSPYYIQTFQNSKIEGEIHLIPELLFRQNVPIVIDADFYVSIGSKLKNTNTQEVWLYKGKLI